MKQEVSEPTTKAAAYDPFARGGLVIMRRVGEQFVIGREPNLVVVTVLGLDRGKAVFLQCHAPAGVPIHRREVFDRIRAKELAKHAASDCPLPQQPDQGDQTHASSNQAAQSTPHNPSSSSAA